MVNQGAVYTCTVWFNNPCSNDRDGTMVCASRRLPLWESGKAEYSLHLDFVVNQPTWQRWHADVCYTQLLWDESNRYCGAAVCFTDPWNRGRDGPTLLAGNYWWTRMQFALGLSSSSTHMAAEEMTQRCALVCDYHNKSNGLGHVRYMSSDWSTHQKQQTWQSSACCCTFLSWSIHPLRVRPQTTLQPLCSITSQSAV